MAEEFKAPLTKEEVEELDSYGMITGLTPLPPRALELWQREIYWGREGVMPAAHGLQSLLGKDA